VVPRKYRLERLIQLKGQAINELAEKRGGLKLLMQSKRGGDDYLSTPFAF
jgi:hypothetical protein